MSIHLIFPPTSHLYSFWNYRVSGPAISRYYFTLTVNPSSLGDYQEKRPVYLYHLHRQVALDPLPRLSPHQALKTQDNAYTPSKQSTSLFSDALMDLINIHEFHWNVLQFETSTGTALTLASFVTPNGLSRWWLWGSYTLVFQDSITDAHDLPIN